MAADRIRIASSGKLHDTLSAQHLISCNHDHLQQGCQGGHIDRAWWYLRHFGSVFTLLNVWFIQNVLYRLPAADAYEDPLPAVGRKRFPGT